MAEHGSPQWAPPGGQPASPVSQAPVPQAPIPQTPIPQTQPPQYAGAAQPNYYVGGPPAPGPMPVTAPPLAPMPGGRGGRSGPVRIDPVPGTEFGVAIGTVPPTFCGQAIGSLVAGIASIVVSLVVGCFGVVGGSGGWGVIVSGAFAILAGLLGLASVGLGLVAVRLVKASRGRLAGRGVAISGIVCGATGVLLTAGGMLLALVSVVAA